VNVLSQFQKICSYPTILQSAAGIIRQIFCWFPGAVTRLGASWLQIGCQDLLRITTIITRLHTSVNS